MPVVIVCLDVHYDGDTGHAAAVAFENWDAQTSLWEGTTVVENVEPYVSKNIV